MGKDKGNNKGNAFNFKNGGNTSWLDSGTGHTGKVGEPESKLSAGMQPTSHDGGKQGGGAKPAQKSDKKNGNKMPEQLNAAKMEPKAQDKKGPVMVDEPQKTQESAQQNEAKQFSGEKTIPQSANNSTAAEVKQKQNEENSHTHEETTKANQEAQNKSANETAQTAEESFKADKAGGNAGESKTSHGSEVQPSASKPLQDLTTEEILNGNKEERKRKKAEEEAKRKEEEKKAKEAQKAKKQQEAQEEAKRKEDAQAAKEQEKKKKAEDKERKKAEKKALKELGAFTPKRVKVELLRLREERQNSAKLIVSIFDVCQNNEKVGANIQMERNDSAEPIKSLMKALKIDTCDTSDLPLPQALEVIYQEVVKFKAAWNDCFKQMHVYRSQNEQLVAEKEELNQKLESIEKANHDADAILKELNEKVAQLENMIAVTTGCANNVDARESLMREIKKFRYSVNAVGAIQNVCKTIEEYIEYETLREQVNIILHILDEYKEKLRGI